MSFSMVLIFRTVCLMNFAWMAAIVEILRAALSVGWSCSGLFGRIMFSPPRPIIHIGESMSRDNGKNRCQKVHLAIFLTTDGPSERGKAVREVLAKCL